MFIDSHDAYAEQTILYNIHSYHIVDMRIFIFQFFSPVFIHRCWNYACLSLCLCSDWAYELMLMNTTQCMRVLSIPLYKNAYADDNSATFMSITIVDHLQSISSYCVISSLFWDRLLGSTSRIIDNEIKLLKGAVVKRVLKKFECVDNYQNYFLPTTHIHRHCRMIY